jgi:hypothetical protein
MTIKRHYELGAARRPCSGGRTSALPFNRILEKMAWRVVREDRPKGGARRSGPIVIPFETVQEIRRRWEANLGTYESLAREFGISEGYVRSLVGYLTRVFR